MDCGYRSPNVVHMLCMSRCTACVQLFSELEAENVDLSEREELAGSCTEMLQTS